MAARFRMPCKMALYQGNGRPQKPNWMLKGNAENATRNQKRSLEYWSHIWQATPPWINQEHIAQMKETYLAADETMETDHEVPLNNPLVCGLHVPWNLKNLTIAENQHKSNNHWPDMPNEQLKLNLGE